MATITTAIKEPKTFQQIQDQQNEFEKQNMLKDLNENIVKLTQSIGNNSKKELSSEDKQLKSNQLELSRLQLQRAKLGLAKDQKSYTDYSSKYHSTHGVGSSIGVDQNSRDNAGAIALAALSGGALNPVVVKEILLPPLKMMSRAVGGLANNLFSDRRVSGKSSSAVENHEGNRFYNKLDEIVKAIKDKNKPNAERERKEESLFSKVIGAIVGLLGTVAKAALKGLIAAAAALFVKSYGKTIKDAIKGFLTGKLNIDEGKADFISTILKDMAPGIIAGLAVGGIKGALAGGAISMAFEAFHRLKTNQATPIVGDELGDTFDTVNKWIKNHAPGWEFQTREDLELVGASFYLFGLKGMVASYGLLVLSRNQTVKQTLNKIKEYKDKSVLVERTLDDWKNSDPLGIGVSGTTLGAMLGLGALGFTMGGVPGLIAGAMLGLAGGYIFNQWRDVSMANKLGYQTKFNKETGKNELIYSNGESTGLTVTQLWDEIVDEHKDWTSDEIKEELKKRLYGISAQRAKNSSVPGMLTMAGLARNTKKMSSLDIFKTISSNIPDSVSKWWEDNKKKIEAGVTSLSNLGKKFLDTEIEYNGKKTTIGNLVVSPFTQMGNGIKKFVEDQINGFLDSEVETKDGEKTTIRKLIVSPFEKISQAIETFYDEIFKRINNAIHQAGLNLRNEGERIGGITGAAYRAMGGVLVTLSGNPENELEKNKDQKKDENEKFVTGPVGQAINNSVIDGIKTEKAFAIGDTKLQITNPNALDEVSVKDMKSSLEEATNLLNNISENTDVMKNKDNTIKLPNDFFKLPNIGTPTSMYITNNITPNGMVTYD